MAQAAGSCTVLSEGATNWGRVLMPSLTRICYMGHGARSKYLQLKQSAPCGNILYAHLYAQLLAL